MPGFGVLLFLLEAGGAYLLWRWMAKTTGGIPPERALPSLSLFAIFALVLFLLGPVFRDHRAAGKSPAAAAQREFFAGGRVCLLRHRARHRRGLDGISRSWTLYVARGLCVLLGLMAVEMLVTLLLEIYRPRVKGKIARPLYESRLVGLLAQPESLFTTAAQTLDYQFGFKVSETWFFQLLQKNLPLLLLAQLAVLFLSTGVVFIDAGEQAVLERFGRPAAVLGPGAHLKLPWPADRIYRYRTEQIQTFDVGYTPDAQSEQQKTILWSLPHAKEENFLVGNRAPATILNASTDTNNTLKAPPVSLITRQHPGAISNHQCAGVGLPRTPTRRLCCRIWPRAPWCIFSPAWI